MTLSSVQENFLGSAQLSMKFQLLIKTKLPKIKDFSCYKTLRCCIYPAINVKMPTVVGISLHDKYNL